MKRLMILGALAGAMLFAGAPQGALAQATRTWVSGTGDDANPCSRTAPCKTFPGAYSKTAVGGEINCIDAGGFGTITIGHSINIKCDNTQAGVLAALGGPGITVNASSTDVIFLSGLDIEGGAPGANPGGVGLKINSAGSVTIVNSVVKGFLTNGIQDAATTPHKLVIGNTIIADNTGGGVLIAPLATGGNTIVSIKGAQVTDNSFGVRADGTSSTGPVAVSIDNTTVANNANAGITATTAASGGQPTSIQIIRSASTGNGVNGVNAVNTNAKALIGYSSVAHNLGVALNASSGGVVQSYQNNEINSNTGGDGTFTTTALK